MTVIGQHGEAPPEGYILLTGRDRIRPIGAESRGKFSEYKAVLSEATSALCESLLNERAAMIREAVSRPSSWERVARFPMTREE